MSVDVEIVVVGAGVVGLAVAARLARPGRSLVVLERHDGICRETSSRNSEVVHAGIYYPPGSLKARSCVRGKALLYARCDRAGVAAPRCGKWIVGTRESDREHLEELASRAAAGGVSDLEWVEGSAFRARAPELGGRFALWSPGTGVVDSHRYASALEAEARARGAELVFRTALRSAAPVRGGYELLTDGPDGEFVLTARVVVNAAGHGQPAVSESVGLDLDAAGYRQHPCKGDYFAVAPRHRGRVSSLVYPVGRASAGGLGVHLTVDTGGGMRLGPDAEWLAPGEWSYAVDPAKARRFFEGARDLLPWLEPGDLTPDLAGVRPKLTPEGGGFRDFVVAEESARGLPGWVTLAGIESPGLTACEALAEEVERVLVEAGTAAP